MRKWRKLPIQGQPMIGMVVATYNQDDSLRGLAASLRCQTYTNFKALAVHDGPAEQKYRDAWPTHDPRFLWTELPVRKNEFGHPNRRLGFSLLADKCDYLCNTNGDCWYVPVFFESMLHHLQGNKADFVHCNMVHSHKHWAPMVTEIGRAKIDTGCWLAKTELVMAALPHWTSNEFAADWLLIEQMMKAKPRLAKVSNFFYVHN